MGKARTPAPRAATARDPRTETPKANTPAETPGANADHQVTAEQQRDAAVAPKRKKSELVSVTVPAPLNLHDDNGVLHKYEAGVQDMPRDHAEHWWSKANGVELNED